MLFVIGWAVALFVQFIPLSESIPTISTSGTKFYDSNGNQFYMKGVIYAISIADDPLVDGAQCERDADLMKTLGVNIIRIIYVDATMDHEDCMSAFANAGIYVLVPPDPTAFFNGNLASWTIDQYNGFRYVMDAFAVYNNTLGFAIQGPISSSSDSEAAVYVKASALDLKKYRDRAGYRDIPVGYVGGSPSELMPELQNYLACGAYGLDFFGLTTLIDGCEDEQRSFIDQAAILGYEMQNLWSGAIIYGWTILGGDIGFSLVGYNSTSTYGIPTPLASGGFNNLKSQWQTLKPTGTPSSLYTPHVTPPPCPGSTAGGWLVDGDVPLPTLNHPASTSTVSSPHTNSKAAGPSGILPTTSKTAGGTESGISSLNSSAGHRDLSIGTIVGIAVGVALPVIVCVVAIFLFWRVCFKRKSTPDLDLTPGGLEVAATSEPQSISEGVKHETSERSSITPGFRLAPKNDVTTASVPLQTGQSPIPSRPISSVPSELSTSPISPRTVSARQTLFPIPQNNIIAELKANAPWENEAFPYPRIEVTPAQAQQAPLLANVEERDCREDSPAG